MGTGYKIRIYKSGGLVAVETFGLIRNLLELFASYEMARRVAREWAKEYGLYVHDHVNYRVVRGHIVPRIS